MIHGSLKQLSALLQGKYHGNDMLKFSGISTDSRTLQPGNLFFAIKGENFDGHDFLEQAKNQGAVAAVIQRKISTDLPVIHVADTQQALGQAARDWRQQFSLLLIAVTGSNGKTTTKNMLQAIFQQAYQQPESVLATKGNLNNHIGLPLMLCELGQQHRCAIIEMGMNHFGEIHYLTQLAQPATALITNAGPCHLEGVGGTIAGVAQAKGEIYAGLAEDGIAVINADDDFAAYWWNLIGKRRCLTFGLEKQADVQGKIISGGFALCFLNDSIDISLHLLGKHNVMNALAASAAALANGVSLNDIKIALEKMQPAAGRMETKAGRHGITVIDDTYNANPLSLRAALETVAAYPGKKILVLGDMHELGEQGAQLHTESGKLARQLGIDYLFATGELTRFTVNEFGQYAQHFADHAQLIAALQPYLQPQTTVLVKGSRSMRMEQVVKALVI